MPVATSRRRKTARQASSDIEEDQPTQGGNVRDDVDDADDDAPQRKVKKEKAAVKKEKGTARPQEDPEEDEDDDDDRIDIDNFADQPLTKADCSKLAGFSKDWAGVEVVMHQPSPIIARVAASMAEVAGEEAQEVCSFARV